MNIVQFYILSITKNNTLTKINKMELAEVVDEKKEPEQKLLKDVLDRYVKSQVELCEVLVEIFKRIAPESVLEEDEVKKRKIYNIPS